VNALVLMYHSVPAAQHRRAPVDAFYAVEMPRFIEQLGLMQRLGLTPRSVRDLIDDPDPQRRSLPPVAMTFDDGHETNFAAYAEILRHGGCADFFINPSTVGTKGYLSWAQLREMSRHGASIQSHGMHHVYLNGLSPQEVDHELADSRARIQDELGQSVDYFAPPNGRMLKDTPQRARELGYRAVCSSQVGVWRNSQAAEIPRWAVRADTSTNKLEAWLSRSPRALGVEQMRASALRLSKRLLGENSYRSLRQTLLREGRQG
jgi:peptidoglycan/xylan/chitin deacetylase (PgdA/CDA1 family)